VSQMRESGFSYVRDDVTVKLADAYGFCWGVERAVQVRRACIYPPDPPGANPRHRSHIRVADPPTILADPPFHSVATHSADPLGGRPTCLTHSAD